MFRFLDLPRDIRFMVYERLPRHISHAVIPIPSQTTDDHHDVTRTSLILLSRSTCTSILATCRQINHEAGPFISRILQNWVEGGTVNVIVLASDKRQLLILSAVLKTLKQALMLTRESDVKDYDIASAIFTEIKSGAYTGSGPLWAFHENDDRIKTFVIRAIRTLVNENKVQRAGRSTEWLPMRVVARNRRNFRVDTPALTLCWDIGNLRQTVEDAGFYRETFALIDYTEVLNACTLLKAPPKWMYSTGYSTMYPTYAVLTADEWQKDWV